MSAQRLSRLPAQHMSRLAAQVLERLRRAPPCTLTLQDQSWVLHWQPQAQPPWTTVLRVRVGAAEFAVLFDDLALTPEWAPELLGMLDEAARRVCVAYGLNEWTQALSHWAGQPVAVLDWQYQRVVHAPVSVVGLCLEDAQGVVRQGCLLPDDDHAWQVLDRLTSHWSGHSPPESQSEDAQWLRFVLGSSLVTVSQWSSVRPGWMMLVQRPVVPERGFAVLTATGERVASFVIAPGAAQARKRVEESVLKVSLVQEGTDAVAQQSVDEVAVPIGFEIGGAMLPVQALHALAPGAVMELDRPIEDCTVRIRAGDRIVGTGELVDLEGVLAVRIVTLNGRD